MAEALKDFIDAGMVDGITRALSTAWRGFPAERFRRLAVKGLDGLELMARGQHVAHALEECLPAERDRALRIIVDSLGPELVSSEGNGMAPFFYLPHVLYVGMHGPAHFDDGMAAQHALTRRFSAEFSMRAFLRADAPRTFRVLRKWTRDPSEHVRRLCSEGTRPRLPWATRVPSLLKDPGPVMELLERLRHDPSAYVRRSVANNLNDISRDHPDAVLATCGTWIEDGREETRRMVSHGLRGLVKHGHPGAMAVLGFGGGDGIRVTAEVRPRRVTIGGRVTVEARVENLLKVERRVVVDLAVFFVKADGSARPRVFKGRNVDLPPGGSVTVTRSVSLAVHTTRTPRPGRHRVDILVGGRPFPAGEFQVVAAGRVRHLAGKEADPQDAEPNVDKSE